MPWFGFWARELLRWGTHDPFVAFALSQGLAQTREAAAGRRKEFETWLDDELEEISSEDLIDPQHFLRWQLSLGRDVRDLFDDLPELVELTGTDGRRRRYNVIPARRDGRVGWMDRSEEHTPELQSLMRLSYAVFCLKKKKTTSTQ